MIVDPDFPDHWKTRVLVNCLEDDEAGPLYVLRIWAHCQLRRAWTFQNLPPTALKALCRYPGHPSKLEAGLVTSGFVRRGDNGDLIVHEWEIYNASLIASWRNGKKGGRPPSQRGDNPPETQGIPPDNPGGTDRSRGDIEIKRDRAREAPGGRLEDPPSLEVVLEAAKVAGIPPEHATQFFHACEARPVAPSGGWTTRDGQPMNMTRWRSALAAYSASMSRSAPSHHGGRRKTPSQSKYIDEF